MKHLFGLALLLLTIATVHAQEYGGYHFGIKGGLTIAQQEWNDFERDPLFAYHGAVFIESLPESARFSLLAQLGYHVKGSTIRYRFLGTGGDIFTPPAESFEFYNLSLMAGAKQVFNIMGNSGVYYLLGLRLDYTLDTNLDAYGPLIDNNPQFAGYYPIDSYDLIRRFNYGFTAGGGLQFPFSEFVGMNLELRVNPDFSVQYQQPAISNVTNPYNNQPTTLPERQIRNLTFELSLGLRLLRKIEYVD